MSLPNLKYAFCAHFKSQPHILYCTHTKNVHKHIHTFFHVPSVGLINSNLSGIIPDWERTCTCSLLHNNTITTISLQNGETKPSGEDVCCLHIYRKHSIALAYTWAHRHKYTLSQTHTHTHKRTKTQICKFVFVQLLSERVIVSGPRHILVWDILGQSVRLPQIHSGFTLYNGDLHFIAIWR